jgi:hypothetical protein
MIQNTKVPCSNFKVSNLQCFKVAVMVAQPSRSPNFQFQRHVIQHIKKFALKKLSIEIVHN